jgi:hypothetical protein
MFLNFAYNLSNNSLNDAICFNVFRDYYQDVL